MALAEIQNDRLIEDDAGRFEEAIRRGLPRPIILWGHPRVGQSAIVEAAARSAGLTFRAVDPEQLESWEDFRDVSESGHFREVSIEKFLARGERGDPGTFTLEPGSVLYLKDLNRAPTRLVEAVTDQMLSEGKLLNNPLPDDLRIVASCQPPDRHAGLRLIGQKLGRRWETSDDPPSFTYPVFPLPLRLVASADHWAVLPSIVRFVTWGRRQGLAEEVLGFLEEEIARDLDEATAMLHASLLRKADFFQQIASPRAFAELGSLLTERRLYFSSRKVREYLASAADVAEFQQWLHAEACSWNGDRWIESESSLTVRGESVAGSVWLNHVCEQIQAGKARVSLDDLATYAAYERRSLAMWATQELGDDLGQEFVKRASIGEPELARLRSKG